MSSGLQKSVISQELKLRIVSALLLAALVLTMTWIGGKTYMLLWGVIALLVFWEFSRICAASMPIPARVSAFIFLVLVLVSIGIGLTREAYLILGGGLFAVFALEMVLTRTFWAATALVYSAVPFLAFSQLRGDSVEGLIATLIVFAIVWGADILAYFAGRRFGGPKLAPVISPNKTWSGFFGGLVGSLVLAGIFALIAGQSVGIAFWILVLCASVVSQIGDLTESYVKRKFDVKDSGSIIPGHGGVLDRIDGLIFAGAFVWGLLVILASANTMPENLPAVFSAFFLSP